MMLEETRKKTMKDNWLESIIAVKAKEKMNINNVKVNFLDNMINATID